MSGPARATHTLTGASPDGQGVTSIVATTADSLGGFDTLTIIATLTGATGDTLDVYLQNTWDGSHWYDYAHFPQLAAAAAVTTKVWSVTRGQQLSTLTAIGTGTATAATPALVAGTCLGTDWGTGLRMVCVSGASTTAGATQTIVLNLARLSELS